MGKMNFIWFRLLISNNRNNKENWKNKMLAFTQFVTTVAFPLSCSFEKEFSRTSHIVIRCY